MILLALIGGLVALFVVLKTETPTSELNTTTEAIELNTTTEEPGGYAIDYSNVLIFKAPSSAAAAF